MNEDVKREIDSIIDKQPKKRLERWVKILLSIVFSLILLLGGYGYNFTKEKKEANKQEIIDVVNDGFSRISTVMATGFDSSLKRDQELKLEIGGLKGTVEIIKKTLPETSQNKIKEYENLRNEILNEKKNIREETFIPAKIEDRKIEFKNEILTTIYISKDSVEKKSFFGRLLNKIF